VEAGRVTPCAQEQLAWSHVMSVKSWQSSARYCGSWPCNALCTRTASLWPYNSCITQVTLPSDHGATPVQAVPVGAQVVRRSAPDYTTNVLTPASNIPSWPSLRSSSNCDLVIQRARHRLVMKLFPLEHPAYMGSAANWTETLTFDCFFQKTSEGVLFFVECEPYLGAYNACVMFLVPI